MNYTTLYVQLIITAILVAISCSLPGALLVLRGTSLISDAISHAILLGIVLSFLIIQKLHTVLLFLGATLTGLITVACIERMIQSKRLQPDSIIGVVFPFLFSIAIVLINQFAHSIHLDVDAVLLGELAFTPFYQLTLFDYPIGSYALWIMTCIMVLNFIIIYVYYRPIISSTFDHDYAQTTGQKPCFIHWIIMTITCITIVGAFECAGAILVVAFMIIPPATAYLITNHIKDMFIITFLISILAAVSGCLLANYAQLSLAGSIATMNGFIFGLALIYRRLTRSFA